MTTSIHETLRQYLRCETSLEALREWLALSQWDLSDADEELADYADVALVHLDDGYIDEATLRLQLGHLLEKSTIVTARITSGRIPETVYPLLRPTTGTAADRRELVLWVT